MPSHVPYGPGCGRSVTDCWGWDAHEAQLCCPDEVDGDIWIWSTKRALNLSSTTLPKLWSPWKSFPSRTNLHGRTGNRTRDLIISSRKLWPLDHEAGPVVDITCDKPNTICPLNKATTLTQIHKNHAGLWSLCPEQGNSYRTGEPAYIDKSQISYLLTRHSNKKITSALTVKKRTSTLNECLLYVRNE
jgi:hypothetical protein